MRAEGEGADWLTAFRRYLPAMAFGNLVWETVQLPLYTIWREGSPREIAVAVLHCTAGDLMIGALSLVAALALVGHEAWPRARFATVLLVTVLLGLGYTVWSEYFNTAVRRAWAYSAWMPTLPWLGTGLSPVMQWIIVPLAAFASARCVRRRDILRAPQSRE